MEKCFEVTEYTKKLKCERDLDRLRLKLCFLRQSSPKYLAETKEIP